jgi:hypothetical protein
MKNVFCAIVAISSLLFANTVFAQESSQQETPKKKKQHELTITTNGIRIQQTDSAHTKVGVLDSNDTKDTHKGKFSVAVGPVDLGINILADNTNYNDPSVHSFLRVPANEQNKSLFDLRQGKSINVNVYPISVIFRALKTHNQKIYISSGIGLQLYNFRYESPVTFTKNPTGIVIMDSMSFKKNKLALDYLNIPLMFTFKTRLNKDNWLVYGVGITEGFLISSWTKQESGQIGKVRVHDAFGLASFNTCVTAEFGLDDAFRFYATYQLTSMFGSGIGLDQHPFSFGIRFSGI